VTVWDAGRGFDPGATPPGGGLGEMRTRATLLGGTLHIDAAPGAGVKLSAALPLADSVVTMIASA